MILSSEASTSSFESFGGFARRREGPYQFDHFGICLPLMPASRDEAGLYLRAARVALLEKLGYSHPLICRTKSDGSLEAAKSSPHRSEPLQVNEHFSGAAANDGRSWSEGYNPDSDPTREQASVRHVSGKASDDDWWLRAEDDLGF